ncbi:hypothetical protein ASG95_07305 [Phycicoccus sp. Soil803]|nr:hypothetical protein ASG95_07305 [Phycicoccus sp. Soil803]
MQGRFEARNSIREIYRKLKQHGDATGAPQVLTFLFREASAGSQIEGARTLNSQGTVTQHVDCARGDALTAARLCVSAVTKWP